MIAFEMCVGFNGKVWVKAEMLQHTIFILNALEKVAEMYMQNLLSGNHAGYQDPDLRQAVDKIVSSLQVKDPSKKKEKVKDKKKSK